MHCYMSKSIFFLFKPFRIFHLTMMSWKLVIMCFYVELYFFYWLYQELNGPVTVKIATYCFGHLFFISDPLRYLFWVSFFTLIWESVYYFYVLKLKAISSIMLQSHHSVQFSHSVVSYSLWPHESQHARPPCPSPTPRVYSNSCPSSRWCHPAISSSVIPSSSSTNPSQHQGLLQWVSSSHEVAKVLEFQLQPQSFQWTPRIDLL